MCLQRPQPHTHVSTYSGNKWKKNWDSNICFVFLLVLHKNKIEGAVEDCVDKVRGGQIEDEEVGHGPHLPVIWTKTVRCARQSVDSLTILTSMKHRFHNIWRILLQKGLLFIESAYILITFVYLFLLSQVDVKL